MQMLLRQPVRRCKEVFSRGYASSVPILPLTPSTSVSSDIVEIVSNAPPAIIKSSRRRARRFANGGFGGGNDPKSNPNEAYNNYSPKYSNTKAKYGDFFNLFSIYGNILVKEGDELLNRYEVNVSDAKNFADYPIDPALIGLFENSTAFWYNSSSKDLGENKRFPSMLSVNAGSRKLTWELAKHLIHVSGKSHLALIPFSMFYELLQSCYAGRASGNFSNSEQMQKDSKSLGEIIISNISNSAKSNKNGMNTFSFNRESIGMNSKAVIQVIEYLFACLEASVGQARSNERFTLLLDGLEEYLVCRKGGEAVMRDLSAWAENFDSSGRKIVLGGRNQALNLSESEPATANKTAEEEESNGNEDDPMNQNNNSSAAVINIGPSNGNKPSSSNQSSPIQVITDFFLKASNSKSCGSGDQLAVHTNVRLEGPIMGLFVSGPKNDKRSLLKYSQMTGIDRKKDIFDLNMAILKSAAANRWSLNLELGLKSKFDFPSSHPEVWQILSGCGREMLTKRKLSRDEVNEIIFNVMGKAKGMTALRVESIAEAIENISKIRHDPTRFSSDDLNHLLAERQLSVQSLSKYEKRFINCISTATTETRFEDISLPSETVKTLRSLTTLPLTHPELFTQGILKNSLTGVLLFGPPGTGKTMLARAVAQESGAVFLAVNMSNIFDMWVGEGEKNVKGLFNLARKLSPSIIFIDEIDALLERRSSISGRSSRLEIVNEFMSQWDGLSSNLNSGVIVMGATNRPFVLDDAVLRRLPRRLLIDLPDSKGRQEILFKLLKDNLCENDLIEALPELATKMEFYSGSDLKNVAITAALKAAIRLASSTNIPSSSKSTEIIITRKDFEEAAMEVPASLSDQMDSLIELRRWNEIYGETKKIGQRSVKKFGFASG